MELFTPIIDVPRVGKTLEKRLKGIGISNVEDLLLHYPFRYEDYSKLLPLSEIQPGQTVTVKVTVEMIANKRSTRRKTVITEAIVSDDTDRVKVVWFGQSFLTKQISIGDELYLSGSMSHDRFGRQFTSPQYETVKKGEDAKHTARIIPIYTLTSGITQKNLRSIIGSVLDNASKIKEWIPEEILERLGLLGIGETIKKLHEPKSQKDIEKAQERIKFNEFFVLQLRALAIRRELQSHTAPEFKFNQAKTTQFVNSLPFVLTGDQKRASWEIIQDMEKSIPMNRLLQGDVGAGKTAVAAMAMHEANLSGYQAAMMAPTEILAIQHFGSLKKLFSPDTTIALLTSSTAEISTGELVGKSKKAKREDLLEKLNSGEIDVLVGTHAMIVGDVAFDNLGLAIIDEQHRFGVNQRRALREKAKGGGAPHFLSMTATPIPRSYALTLYGDLDISIIKEKPAGRKEIITRVVDGYARSSAYEFINSEVEKGRQVFVICPLIVDEGKKDDDKIILPAQKNAEEKKTVMAEYEKLSTTIFPERKVAYVHGKMRPKEKNEVMDSFSRGEIDILVSTSVVEVGVDVPNASVMMIEGSENFGLAQLHQFRGRVGRSGHQSYCFVLTDSTGGSIGERLNYFASTNDGFALADYDLQKRGAGEMYGTLQSGEGQFRMATFHDVEIGKVARDAIEGIDLEKHPELLKKIEEFENGIHLE